MNVQEYLNKHHIHYDTLSHDPTYSAQTLAERLHVPGHRVAKTVLLWADDGYVVAVLPASHNVEMDRVREMLSARVVELAAESECGSQFNDCELGALPPFGSGYGMRTLIDESLLDNQDIVFEGNNHHEAIRMRCQDLLRL